LTICSWLAFIPLLFLDIGIPYVLFVLLAIPMFFTAKSLLLIQPLKKSLAETRGEEEIKEGISAITKNAFTGMILIPVALIVIFVLTMVL